MYTLRKWSLKNYCGVIIYANGNVYGHHRLCDGDYIHTSEIEKIYLCADDEYLIKTRSGSLYHLPVDEMAPDKCRDTREILGQFKILDEAECADQLAAEKEMFYEKQKLISAVETTAKEHMDEDGLYLLMEGMHTVKAVLKKNSEFRKINVAVHVGMFQDSVLITDLVKGEVDFRYFCNYMMEPYFWSDSLNCIFIHNISRHNILFKGIEQNIECKVNEVTKIRKDQY